MEKPYEVRRSKIHGTGIFAAKDIKKGEKVAEYVGEIVSSEEGTRLEKESLKKNGVTYIFQLDNKRDINGDVPGNDPKFINHSCDPNCESDGPDGKVFVIAVKDIKKGEEITYDYYFEFENEAEHLKHKCNCGSKNCNGYISY